MRGGISGPEMTGKKAFSLCCCNIFTASDYRRNAASLWHTSPLKGLFHSNHNNSVRTRERSCFSLSFLKNHIRTKKRLRARENNCALDLIRRRKLTGW